MFLIPPADGLLFISDACLPECPVGFLQAECDSPLQIIFIVASEINDICINKTYTWPLSLDEQSYATVMQL